MAYVSSFFFLQCFRMLLATTLVLGVSTFVSLPTSTTGLLIASFLSIIFFGYWIKSSRSLKDLLILHALALGLVFLVSKGLEVFYLDSKTDNPATDFSLYLWFESLNLLFLVYLLFGVLTWCYWRRSWGATLESLLLPVSTVILFASHRGFNFESPKKLNSLAWELNISSVHLFLAVSSAVVIFFVFYLYFSENRKLIGRKNSIDLRSAGNRTVQFMFIVLSLFLLSYSSYIINKKYSLAGGQQSSGVGQSGEQGSSPLGFHSATGKTKQPAALLRLEGDYEENPWAPMLYLRENALSKFNGRELVIADRSRYDLDAPLIAPGATYQKSSLSSEINRREITQSVFLLVQQKTPFALDYPILFRPLKNPDPERFTAAYQALSRAPVLSLQEIIDEKVLSSSWSKEKLRHYTRAPGSMSNAVSDSIEASPMLDKHGEDIRYKLLSEELTQGLERPIEKAIQIAQYLSKESIYTRAPGHKITNKGDPVSPYLFSKEKRGYCVHFAHAAAYLFRLAGIPARIGTGYLTDLRYAKDAHVLLHMGDRHAWPEIYVDNYGWVVIDVTPERAEDEEPIVPDQSLLEELMGKIDPNVELIQPEVLEELSSKYSENDSEFSELLFLKRAFPFAVAFIFASWILLKAWIRYGYLFSSSALERAHMSLRALISETTDLGYPRVQGETLFEYSQRVNKTWSVNMLKLDNLAESMRHTENKVSKEEIANAHRQALADLKKSFSFSRRVLAFFHPRSVERYKRW